MRLIWLLLMVSSCGSQECKEPPDTSAVYDVVSVPEGWEDVSVRLEGSSTVFIEYRKGADYFEVEFYAAPN